MGATVVHKSLIKLFVSRGVKVDETYQLNIGGDADFLNMLEESRLVDKRESKTSAVRAMSPYPIPTRIGPSDYVDFLKNDKICYVYIKGHYFGNIPVTLDLKLHVMDAYNSGGVIVDAIRGPVYLLIVLNILLFKCPMKRQKLNFLNSLLVIENVKSLIYLLSSNNSFNTEKVLATSFVFTTIIVSVKQLTVSSIFICLLAT